ncbi:MAG: glucose-6-phosphate dehydrogenase [Clostridiales bacterium]|nr:glucose-6-phosphate dehydrogenase [Clostridiales bacterium]
MTLKNHHETPGRSLLMMIFGGTGDLTHRKLLPAMYHLIAEGRLPEECSVISIGRRDLTEAEYREQARASVKEHSRSGVDEQHMERFLSKLHYKRMEFISDPGSYAEFREWLEKNESLYKAPAVRLFFLAVAPEFFGLIVQRLRQNQLIVKRNPDHRVMIEKPFGSDLASARELNATITEALDEKQVYRIDHYLGKEMIRNILAIRFGNSIFEPLWNHHYIDNIQITSAETLGVEGRGAYYEQSGILKDMLQNHLLQILALITMEPPADLMPESIRDEKVKALRALRRYEPVGVCAGIAMGQYGPGTSLGKPVPGYRVEPDVAPDSTVPTYIALRASVDNFRWGGVPIYIRAGKRLDRRRTQIVIEFKRLPGVNYYQEFREQPPNLLVIEVQPAEGMYFQINAKKPGNEFRMNQVELNYSQNIRFQGNVPEAYEQLILEAFRANSSLFTRWDELEQSWQFVESVEQMCAEGGQAFPNYAAGSRGPARADRLLHEEGREWREIDLPESARNH